LGEIFEVARGGSPRPIKDFLTYDNEGINWIKISDAKEDSKYIEATKEKIKKEGIKYSRLVKPNDLLLSNSMSYGKAFISKIEGCIHDGWLVLHPKNNYLNIEFFYYLLNSQFIKSQFDKYVKGGIVKNLNTKIVKNLLIPLPFKDGKPDLEKQRQIVERIETLFSKIDQAIKLRQRALEETKKLFESVLNKIFKEAEEDKERWRWVRLGDIAKFGIGKTPKRSEKKYWEDGKYYWVSISDMQGKYITDTKEKVSQEAFEEVFKGKLIPRGTLLMSFKLTVGRTAILDVPAFHNEAIIHIYPKENVYRDFLYYILPALDYSRYLNPAIKGRTLNKDVLKNLLIPLPFKNNQPDLEKQKQIAEYLDNLHKKIKRLEQLQKEQLERFQKLKESILNKAFRGELV